MSAHQFATDWHRADAANYMSVPDPGNAGTIKTRGKIPARVALVTAAAETRTVAVPTGPGQILYLYAKTIVTSCTVTVTSGYDQDGNTSLVFATAGDFVALYSIEVGANFRWRVMASDGVYTKSRVYQVWGNAKVGTTAGWTVNAASNRWSILCPASQTAATLVIPIEGLRIGDKITAFKVVGQLESAGNAATLDADLRKLTGAAADLVDASVGAITQISKTADYLIADAKTGLAEVIAENETFYVLLTATTAAATDIDLQGVTVTVQQKD